jgi:uncharacterized protein
MTAEPFVGNLLLFGRLLRRAGLDIHHSRLIDAIRALEWTGIGDRRDVRATLAALLVHRHEDIERFNAAFALFFRARHESTSSLPLFSLGERPRVVARPVPGVPVHVELEDIAAEEQHESTRATSAYSAVSVSRTKDFAEFTPAEMEEARRLLSQLPWRLGLRRTRRWERAAGSAVDLRPMLRQSLMRGELVDLTYRRRRQSPRPIVVIGDVSGSMERYSRILLHFVSGLASHARHVEAFVFSTHLTRITRRLARSRSPLTEVLRDVSDWGGGTRIGEALHTFNTRWARRVMRNGPVLLIVSDGWDRGDPALLAREMARLRRSCRRVLWLNPLLGSANYEPLTRGMQAALPHVDDFLPVHNIASLAQLASVLASPDGPDRDLSLRGHAARGLGSPDGHRFHRQLPAGMSRAAPERS